MAVGVVVNTIKKNISLDYFNEVTRKEILVIHFTGGGSLSGAESSLALPDTINVPYIMDKDGIVYEYFDPLKSWAYHTGANGLCKKSIGLEIVNWGYADLIDGLYLPWTRKKSQAIDPKNIIRVKNFRGKEYFEAITKEQEQALPEFIAKCMSLFPIIEIETHAHYNPRKFDFPPDFKQVYSIIGEFQMCSKLAQTGTLFDSSKTIPVGEEKRFSKSEIQRRINYLIKNVGWNSVELSRLIKYRSGKGI